MGEYVRLADFKGPDLQPVKAKEASQNPNVPYRYSFDSTNFSSIPGTPIAYWASTNFIRAYDQGALIRTFAETRLGMATANNNRFTRFWYEVGIKKCNFYAKSREDALESGQKWFPYNKGGEYRKWYGNNDIVVNWENDGFEIRNFKDERTGRIRSHNYNLNYIFKEGLTWTFVSSSRLGIRYFDNGFLFDVGGSSMFMNQNKLKYSLAFLASKIAFEYLEFLNPTLNFQPGNLSDLPVIFHNGHQLSIEQIVVQNIAFAKADWDSFETSWDFQRHPLLVHKDGGSLEQAFNNWSAFTEEQFQQLKANEEDLNRIFIEIYGLEDELTPEVEDEDITIRRADRERDVRSFISYAVGCMFGRYSLDEEGLVYAGGDFDLGRYRSFPVVEDNILTILDDEYFDNDIVSLFVEFVRVTFGPEMLEQNLEYIADSLRRSASDTARETIRKYFLRDFYPDHTRIYKKRPIYWLFSSPKGGFNSLVYMHRYDRDTVARIRTDYLLAFQDKLSAEEMQLRQLLTTELTAREKTAASNRLKEIEKVMNELTGYQELIHNLANRREAIDLDDGVAVNYAKFQDVLAKIR
jgi:type II restriction/modification system DNA methylase subunit YeeA